jgi:hypothetical protein
MGFRLHPLKGQLNGSWAVTVRVNWRVVFRFLRNTMHWALIMPITTEGESELQQAQYDLAHLSSGRIKHKRTEIRHLAASVT